MAQADVPSERVVMAYTCHAFEILEAMRLYMPCEQQVLRKQAGTNYEPQSITLSVSAACGP